MSSAASSANDKKLLPSEVLKNWASVDIDEEGVFKYVLFEAYAQDEVDGQVKYSQQIDIRYFWNGMLRHSLGRVNRGVLARLFRHISWYGLR